MLLCNIQNQICNLPFGIIISISWVLKWELHIINIISVSKINFLIEIFYKYYDNRQCLFSMTNTVIGLFPGLLVNIRWLSLST